MTKLLDESLHDTQYELHRALSLQLDLVNRTNHLKRETFPMGHEARLQIFPEDHEIVQGWLSGRQDGNSIQHCFHRFYAMRKGFRPEPFLERDDPQRQEKARSFVRLAQQYPWMLCGFCDLDRRYDRLIYSLEVAEECVEWFHSSSSDLQQLATFYSSARQTGFGVIVLRD